jgi:predicted Holliday junction resolvase-like endonuclease
MAIENSNRRIGNHFLNFLLTFLMATCGVLAAYYTTIAGIKLDLAKKAESNVVVDLDKKLSNIEVMLNDKFMTKEEFQKFKEEMKDRLNKIEYQLRIR